jgi:catechol 2,3-dioxygenase-like lactoylglutathione lyase family enzyme
MQRAVSHNGSVIGLVQCIVLDCSDAVELAKFYRALLGGEINRPDPRWSTSETFTTLHVDDGSIYAFQRADNFQRASWPDPARPQQFHLDIDVPDLDQAKDSVIALGATLLHIDERGWLVFADPAGHPFCLL